MLLCRTNTEMSSSNKTPSQTPTRRAQQQWPTPEERTLSFQGIGTGEEPSLFEIGKQMGFLEARCKALENKNKEYTIEIEFLRRERNDLRDKLNKARAENAAHARRFKEHHEKLQDKIEDLQHQLTCLTQRVNMNPAFQMEEGEFIAFKCLANAIPARASGTPQERIQLANLREVGHTNALEYSKLSDTLAETQAIYEFELEAKLAKKEADNAKSPKPDTPETNTWRRIGEAMRQPNRSYDIFLSPQPGWGHTGDWTPNPNARDT